MEFFLLNLVITILFIRPGDLFPVLQPLHPYEVVIATCLVLNFPRLIKEVSGPSLAENPIIACIIGLFAWTVLSDLVRLRFETAWEAAEELGKILIFFLLLASLIVSPSRMSTVLKLLVLCALITIGCAVMHFHGIARFEFMVVTEEVSYLDGEPIEIRRMGATSIFGDPNDCALFIVHGLLICVFLFRDGGGILPIRVLWLLPLTFFGYALTLTQSRGGLVSLMAGLAAYLVGRHGRKAAMIIAPTIPIVLVAFAGRQASMDLGSGTGQSRVQLWLEYLGLFRGNMLLGVGWKAGPESVQLQAHNSYIQAYGEQGFVAGTLFVGAFYLAFRSFGRLTSFPARPATDAGWARLRPCLLALVVSQMVGMHGLTRNLALPTYAVLGLAAAYARSARVEPPLPSGGSLVRHLLVVSVGFLVYLWVLTKVMLSA